MRTISTWARNHKWGTRLLILVIYLLLNAVGFFLGDLFQLMNIRLPLFFAYSACFLFLAALVLYPSRSRKREYKNFYAVHKTTDALLAFSTFILILFAGNHFFQPGLAKRQSLYAAMPAGQWTTPKKPALKVNPVRLLVRGILHKGFNKRLKNKLRINISTLRKQYKLATKGEKTALVILSVIVAVFLVMLLAALSCNIACAGSEGAALVVLVMGTGLIVFLLVKVIMRINRGKPKKEAVPDSTTTGL